MKKYFKEMWVSYVLALVIPYMFFIFEPINMFSSNINDFWFDLSNLIKPSLILFLAVFFGLSIICNILYLANKKVLKIFNVITFVCFICTYIQGNYLVGNLPVLDGTPVDWSKYQVDKIISVVLWVIAIIATIMLCKKFKTDNYLKYGGFIALAIFAMLSVSLLTTLTTTKVLERKQREVVSTSTDKYINKYSTSDNFIILLLDAVDSKKMASALKDNDEASKSLKDFTYYPDTMGVHAFTQESIPFILTGNEFHNQSQYSDYYVDAMKNSKLFNKLYENSYDVNVYEPELVFNDKDALKISNVVNSYEDGNLKFNNKKYIKEQIRYDLFRYLPFFLKQFSHIENLNFNDTRVFSNNEKLFEWETTDFLNYMKMDIETTDKKTFKFMHLLGSHVPYTFDKNLEIFEETSYYDEVEGCVTLLDRYIKYLKDNNVYNNSSIIIMSDHGYGFDENNTPTFTGRQNPILFIKGKNETNNKMTVSDKAVSFADLSDIYNDLIESKKSNEILKNVGTNRTRRYLFYKYTEEYHMEEYESKGKAWETDKMYKTGKEFNLN